MNKTPELIVYAPCIIFACLHDETSTLICPILCISSIQVKSKGSKLVKPKPVWHPYAFHLFKGKAKVPNWLNLNRFRTKRLLQGTNQYASFDHGAKQRLCKVNGG